MRPSAQALALDDMITPEILSIVVTDVGVYSISFLTEQLCRVNYNRSKANVSDQQ